MPNEPHPEFLEHNRRSEDILRKAVADLTVRVGILEGHNIASSAAFSNNDLGLPDYDGHRKSHIALADDAKVLAGFKQEATKNVIRILVTVVLTLLVSGFFVNFTKIMSNGGTP